MSDNKKASETSSRTSLVENTVPQQKPVNKPLVEIPDVPPPVIPGKSSSIPKVSSPPKPNVFVNPLATLDSEGYLK